MILLHLSRAGAKCFGLLPNYGTDGGMFKIQLETLIIIYALINLN